MLRFCDPHNLFTTADDLVYLRKNARSKPILVAKFISLGKHGAPMSWKGNTLIIHLPVNFRWQYLTLLRPTVDEISIRAVNDWTVKEQVRDAG